MAIYVLMAVLVAGHSSQALSGSPGGGLFSDLLGALPGHPFNILNGYQEGKVLANLQNGFLEYPGSLTVKPNDKGAVEELKRQCIARANESVYHEVELAWNNSQKCIVSSLPKAHSLLGDNQVELCKTMHGRFRDCMAEFKAKLEMCLDETSAYIPEHNMRVYDSVFNFLCDQEADNAMTLLMSALQPNNCFQKVQGVSQECLSKTENFAGTHIAIFRNISKSELCSDTSIWKNCLIDDAKKYCDHDALDFVSGMTRAVYEACSSSALVICNTFVLGLFLSFTQFI